MRWPRESGVVEEAEAVGVVLRGGVGCLEELATEWDALCEEGPCDEPFYRPWWIASHLEAFEPNASVVAVTVRRGGRLRAVLPLIEERVRLHGIPVLRLRGAANVHSCRFDLVHGRADAAWAARAAWRVLRTERWEVLELRDVPAGGAAETLLAAAIAEGHPGGVREAMRTPYVPLGGAGPTLDGKFRRDLRRRRRKLEAKGQVVWSRSGDPAGPLFEAFLALEAAGWKGRAGTAIALDPNARSFYCRIAREAARRGQLALHALSLDGRPVAVHLGLEHRGRYLLPKPAYDESHGECSPGQLLVEEVLRDASGRGLEEFDFLGPWMDWKGEWTRHVRPHGFVHVFRKGAAGRLLYALKFGAAPVARRLTGVSPWIGRRLRGSLPPSPTGGATPSRFSRKARVWPSVRALPHRWTKHARALMAGVLGLSVQRPAVGRALDGHAHSRERLPTDLTSPFGLRGAVLPLRLSMQMIATLGEGGTMEATARRFGGGEPSVPGTLVASALPTLRPGMVWPRTRRAGVPFPFDDPGVRYFYYARNGVHALARLWNLAGKEVLFPAYFHGVELEALLEAGVRPRFYPVGERMRVDPALVEKHIGPDTRAIYLIHYVGFPGPVEELRRMCDRRGLRLVEDCALALLSRLDDRPLGTFGDAAVFCLYKTLPAPNGGALVIRGGGPISLPEGDPPPLASTVGHAASSMLVRLELTGGAAGRALRRAARSVGRAAARVSGADRVPTGTQHFDRSRVGLSMSRLSLRVIEAQDFPAIVERRRRNYFHLLGRLRELGTPVFGELPPGVCPLFFPLPVRDKQTVVRHLHAQGVEAIDFWRVGHPAVPPGTFPEVDELRQTILELPCHQDLDPSAIDRLATIVRSVVRGRG